MKFIVKPNVCSSESQLRLFIQLQAMAIQFDSIHMHTVYKNMLTISNEINKRTYNKLTYNNIVKRKLKISLCFVDSSCAFDLTTLTPQLSHGFNLLVQKTFKLFSIG